jgi:hypothetical protein
VGLPCDSALRRVTLGNEGVEGRGIVERRSLVVSDQQIVVDQRVLDLSQRMCALHRRSRCDASPRRASRIFFVMSSIVRHVVDHMLSNTHLSKRLDVLSSSCRNNLVVSTTA